MFKTNFRASAILNPDLQMELMSASGKTFSYLSAKEGYVRF